MSMKKKLQNVLESYNSIYASGRPLSEAVRPNGTIDAISYEETAVDDMAHTLLELFLKEYDMNINPRYEYPNHYMPGIPTFGGYAVPVFRISMTLSDGTDGSELFDEIRDIGEEYAKYIDETFVVDPDFDRKFKDALKRELYGKVTFGRTWSNGSSVKIKDNTKIHFSFTVTPQDVSPLNGGDELTVDVDIEFRPMGEGDDTRIEFGRIPGPETMKKNAEFFVRNHPTPNLPESVQPRRPCSIS